MGQKKMGFSMGYPRHQIWRCNWKVPNEIWLVVYLPPEKYEFVTWDDDSQLNGTIKFMFQTTTQLINGGKWFAGKIIEQHVKQLPASSQLSKRASVADGGTWYAQTLYFLSIRMANP